MRQIFSPPNLYSFTVLHIDFEDRKMRHLNAKLGTSFSLFHCSDARKFSQTHFQHPKKIPFIFNVCSNVSLGIWQECLLLAMRKPREVFRVFVIVCVCLMEEETITHTETHTYAPHVSSLAFSATLTHTFLTMSKDFILYT